MAFDASQLIKGLNEAKALVEAAALKAVDQFGEHVKGDAQDLAPIGGGLYSPNDPAPGTLRASATTEPAKLTGTVITKAIGFNTAYAAVQHENLDFRHDEGEAQYLTKALAANASKLGPFVADRVKGALG